MAKRTISLSQELDARLRELTGEEGQTYSGLVQEAVALYLDGRERRRTHEAYARYYGKPENKRRDADLAEETWDISREDWP